MARSIRRSPGKRPRRRPACAISPSAQRRRALRRRSITRRRPASLSSPIFRDDLGQVAAAFAALFGAAHGGALGLFTAIARLRAVHQKIAPVLEERGLLLLAQHVDAMATATLVDIFRAEEDSCLLGTDAVRDGVDVPGRSLRLIVFDRV